MALKLPYAAREASLFFCSRVKIISERREVIFDYARPGPGHF
jgi:hypothetical protein